MRRYGTVLAVGLAIAVVITFFSPFASAEPDGLEKVAEQHEFLDRAAEPRFNVIPDYAFPGVADERLATVLAGISGVILVAAVTIGAGMLLARRDRDGSDPGEGTAR